MHKVDRLKASECLAEAIGELQRNRADRAVMWTVSALLVMTRGEGAAAGALAILWRRDQHKDVDAVQ